MASPVVTWPPASLPCLALASLPRLAKPRLQHALAPPTPPPASAVSVAQLVDGSHVGNYRMPSTKGEREALQHQASLFAKQISDLLQRLPPPLLLLLKTNDCLRAVDMSLGQPVNTLVITARECTRALADLQRRERPGWGSWLAARVDVLRVELMMAALRLAAWWTSVRRSSSSTGCSGGGSANGGGASSSGDDVSMEEELPPEFERLLRSQGVDVDEVRRASALRRRASRQASAAMAA